jgi:hypothetical protein
MELAALLFGFFAGMIFGFWLLLLLQGSSIGPEK